MQQRDELVGRLQKLVVECLELDRSPDELTPETSLREELGFDSAGLLELVAGIEDEFAIVIETDEITEERFESLASLAGFVGAKL